MPYIANVLQLMIASPSEADHERRVIGEEIDRWNSVHAASHHMVLVVVGSETHSSTGIEDRPKATIKRQSLHGCDLLISIFRTKCASCSGRSMRGAVEDGRSGTVDFSHVPVAAGETRDQFTAVVSLGSESKSRGSLDATYSSLAQFRERFSQQLALAINQEFSDGTLFLQEVERAKPRRVKNSLSEDAKRLLLTTAAGGGRLGFFTSRAQTEIHAHKTQFIGHQTAKEVARWKSALAELRQHELIEDVGSRGEMFTVTDRGYEVADEINCM